jgi:ferredoxin/flavodoxin
LHADSYPMYTIIYFSPTGNVLHLAKLLAEELKSPVENILPLEFTDPEQLENNEHLVLLYPVHGFNAPKIVKRFVKSLPHGLYEFVSLIAVGCSTGWANGAVSSELRKLLRKKDYSIVVDQILAMPLTFIMNFPDDLNLRLIAESELKIADLSSSIIENKTSPNEVQLRSQIINFVGKIEGAAAPLFGLELHANNNCTSCGTCWNNCPAKNIQEKSNGKPGFGFNCTMCMRCIYNCPEKAISPRVSKFIPIKNGYTLSKYIK